MKQITTWTELLFSSMQAFAEQVMRVFPNVLGALFILLIGWLIAKLISKGIVKLLKGSFLNPIRKVETFLFHFFFSTFLKVKFELVMSSRVFFRILVQNLYIIP